MIAHCYASDVKLISRAEVCLLIKHGYICLLSILQAETENILMWEWDEFTSLERPHTISGAGPIPQGCTTRPIPQDHKKEDQSSSN